MIPIPPRSKRAARRSSTSASAARTPAPADAALPPRPQIHERDRLRRDWQSQAVAGSIKAFTVPSLLAPLLLPPHLQHLRFFVMGAMLREQRQQNTIRFVPAPDRRGELTGMALALGPFVPALALHGKLNHMLATRWASAPGQANATFDAAWARFAERLPSAVRPVLRRYPLTAMLTLVPLQVLASGSGAALSGAWHARQGRWMIEQPPPAAGQSMASRMLANPLPWVGAVLPFALPAAFASATGRHFLTAMGLGAAGTSAAITLSAILAAITPPTLAARHKDNPPGAEPNTGSGSVR